MGKRNTRKKQNNQRFLIFTILMVLISLFLVFGEKYDFIDTNQISQLFGQEQQNEIQEIKVSKQEGKLLPQAEINEQSENIIRVYFFDVGQADSILFISKNETMLIDAGTNETGNRVVENLRELGITKLNYLIGTHPHEDHIGGMDDIINNFEIEHIYMPKIQTNTKTFEDVLDSISQKGLKITAPKQGSTFMVGDIQCEVMLCGSGTEEEQKENLNLSSIVIRSVYGEQSFLLMGDAEAANEKSRTWPETTVLKVGHHGSTTSSSSTFLNQIKPQIAIISCGKDNSYGHPKQTILNRLQKLGTNIYRTDEKGTIMMISDGKNYKIKTQK